MLLMACLLVFAGVASAANDYNFTLHYPAASADMSGDNRTLKFAMENTTAVGLTNVTNVTFFYQETGSSTVTYLTTNSSDAAVGSFNETYTANYKLNLGVLSDAETYTIYGCGWNYSATSAAQITSTYATAENVTCDSSTLVTVDHTSPTCGISSVSANEKYSLDGTVLTANAYNASSCKFLINNQAFIGTITDTNYAEVCSYTLQNSDLAEGTYTIDAQSTDSSGTADTTSCASIGQVNFYKPTSTAKAAVVAAGLGGAWYFFLRKGAAYSLGF